MDIILKKDGIEYKVQIGEPTFERKQKLRELSENYVSECTKIDNKFKENDLEKDALALVRKANEVDKISDKFIIGQFKAIAINVPEEIKSEFASEENSDFWQKQNLKALSDGIKFFRRESAN